MIFLWLNFVTMWFGYVLTEYEVPRRSSGKITREYPIHIEDAIEKPNEMSEELLKCLIGIFLELNKASLDREESETVPRLTLPCIKSTGLIAKASSNSKAPSNSNVSCLDPYGISSDLDCTARDVGSYKNFIQITRSSLDIDRFSQCLPAFRKLRLIFAFIRALVHFISCTNIWKQEIDWNIVYML